MYLKEITANGFKSFAEKTTITLDDRITCIVGPNGSGKSNIVDAVRWVLGEQSVKSLRGDGTMSDVIFSGSKSRKAQNVASVNLIFDNSDNYLKIPYTDVSIKRRVYRSGENEYFLNGEKCRLKDITDLLLDSGMGKESFNIISQGEVDRILSNSSYDRRLIFEEAAGVLKYKKRKEEALRKLERTNQNLERVGDIIQELNIQLEPLKEQSKKAKEYLKNKEGLEKLEVACLVYDITTINDAYNLCLEKKENIIKENVTLSNKTSSEDTKLSVLKQAINDLEITINDEQKALLTASSDAITLNGKRELLKERKKIKLDEKEELIRFRLLKEEEQDNLSKQAVINAEVNYLKEQLTKSENSINNLNKDKLAIVNEQKMHQMELNAKNQELLTLSHRLEIVNNDIDNDIYMPKSIKELFQNNMLKGLYKTISQALSYDEEYEKAVSVAIISCRNFVITETDEDASKAISYLKDKHLGRATFFPLNIIKPRGIDYQTNNILINEVGYMKTLVDAVTYDKKFHNVISNQLGNIILVDTIEHAQNISRKIDNRYKIVTLDGDIFHVGGSISGGSLNKQNTIATLKQEAIRLHEKIVSYKEVTIKLFDEIKKLNLQEENIRTDYYKYLEEQVSIKEQIDVKNEQLNNINIKLKTIIEETTSLEKMVNGQINVEETNLLNKYYEKKTEVDSLTKLLSSNQLELEMLKKELEENMALDKLNQTALRNNEKSSKNLEIEISKMDVKLDNMLEVLSNEYMLTYEKAKEQYFLDMNIEDAKNKVRILKENIKNIGMINLSSIEEEERVETRYLFLNNQKDDLLGAKDTLLEIMSEMDEVMKREFIKTFNKINIEFKEVFKELFKGGMASLKLTSPDNILETGVEIIASPPGKKLTTISLLSGGEKTLTAISLLFSILNVRTIPFCLFDEVEASLDEANVDQFGKYLDHYKKRTQFLIITHKKKTMEYADTLYGITMQESGVSKLVSVRLNDKEEVI